MHDDACDAKAHEGEDKSKIAGIKCDRMSLKAAGETVPPAFRPQAERDCENEERQDRQTHRVILPAFQKHSAQTATQAARQPAAGTRQAGAKIEATNSDSGAVRRIEASQQQPKPCDANCRP